MFIKENITLILILIVIFLIATTTIWKLYDSKNWVNVDGKVNSIELTAISNTYSKNAGSKSTDYKIDIEYLYSFNEKELTGEQFYPLVPNVFSDKAYADELMSKFAKGSNIIVHVNPSSPHDSCLIVEKGISIWSYIFLFGFFIAVISALGFGIHFFNKL